LGLHGFQLWLLRLQGYLHSWGIASNSTLVLFLHDGCLQDD